MDDARDTRRGVCARRCRGRRRVFAAVVDVEAGMFPEEEVGKEQFRIHMRMMENFWNSGGEGGCGA
jgi:hypothetical protein